LASRLIWSERASVAARCSSASICSCWARNWAGLGASPEAARSLVRRGVDLLGDALQAVGAVVDGVHRRDDREQRLRGADVARRLLAADVLLPRLEGQPVRGGAVGVDGHAHQAAGQLALEAGCRFTIDSDAHAPGHFSFLDLGAARAEANGVPADRIVTTWPAERLLEWAVVPH